MNDELEMDDFDERQHDDEEPDEAARRIIAKHINKLDTRLKLLRRSAKSQNRYLNDTDREQLREWMRRQIDLTLDTFQDVNDDSGGFSFTGTGEW
jgi:hypothetical protein